MALVWFEFSRIERGNLSGFDLGDMMFVLGSHRHASAGHMPSQSMMIYLAIADLIAGLCKVANGAAKAFVFVGADSSYSLTFSRKKREIAVSIGRRHIGNVPIVDLVSALSAGVKRFLEDPKNRLSPDDPANEDLQAALVTLNETMEKPI